MKKFRAIFWSIIEYLLGALFVLGGVNAFSAGPVSGAGPVARLLGGEAALIFYGILFMGVGLYVIASKVLKNRRHHKHALVTMYLVCLFVVFLEWAIVGAFTIALLDQIVIGALAAGLWLRWKLLTEYIDPREYDKIRQEILDEQALDEHYET